VRVDKRRGVMLVGLQKQTVATAVEALDVMADAARQRTTANNNANAHSSRSHAVTMVEVSIDTTQHGAVVHRWGALAYVAALAWIVAYLVTFPQIRKVGTGRPSRQ